LKTNHVIFFFCIFFSIRLTDELAELNQTLKFLDDDKHRMVEELNRYLNYFSIGKIFLELFVKINRIQTIVIL